MKARIFHVYIYIYIMHICIEFDGHLLQTSLSAHTINKKNKITSYKFEVFLNLEEIK